jgi:hypothetical protein
MAQSDHFRSEHAISVGPWGCTFFFVYAQEPTA